MILVSFKALCLSLGVLSACIPVHGEESNKHSLRGGDTKTARLLTGDGGDVVTIDFDEYGLSRGDYVDIQYESDYGLTFSSSGGCSNIKKPRIFDTNNPGTAEAGDPDLGSPNESCHPSPEWDGDNHYEVVKEYKGHKEGGIEYKYGTPGGPGIGKGGERGKPGENCKPLNNVLIIQECNDDMSIPDDNADGGKIFLDFDPPAEYVYDMGFLDNDYGGKLIVEYANGSTETFTLPELGDNAYEEIDINRSNVRRITLDIERSGAIAFIRFRPGSRTDIIEIPFYTSFVDDADACFDPVAWCDIEVFTILMASLESSNDLTQEQFDVFLNGLQALFCDAAAEATAYAYGIIRGEGVFRLDRLGGNVEEINLNVNMNTATLALADVEASAVADADSYAYAFAKAQDCSRYKSDNLKYSLCALAKGQAQSEAIAEARSYASAAATASASTSTNVAVMVNANRINEFDAQVNSGASSFVISGAFATADAFAAAYAQALAKIKLSSKVEEYHCCRHKTRHRSKICRYKNKCKWHYDWKCGGECGWWSLEYRDKFMAKAEAVASAVASSFASAWAESLASIDINMSMRAYFKGGSKNVFMFRSDNSVAIDATTQCFA